MVSRRKGETGPICVVIKRSLSLSHPVKVEKLPLVGDLQVGAVASFRGFQLAYNHVFRSDEFEGQRDNASFGAFSVLVAF